MIRGWLDDGGDGRRDVVWLKEKEREGDWVPLLL